MRNLLRAGASYQGWHSPGCQPTGLNTALDELIELAMVKLEYLPDDRIARITDVFSSFNEPSITIPGEIAELTGITDEMVSGHRIDPEAAASFVSDAVLVVAHNAHFDRKFAERYWPLFLETALSALGNGGRMEKAWL